MFILAIGALIGAQVLAFLAPFGNALAKAPQPCGPVQATVVTAPDGATKAYQMGDSGAVSGLATVTKTGDVWVAHIGTPALERLSASDPAQRCAMPILVNKSGTKKRTIDHAESVVVDSTGIPWFVDPVANAIGTLENSTVALHHIPSKRSGATGLIVGPFVGVWFSESNTNALAHVAEDHKVYEFTLPPDASNPGPVVWGNGAAWTVGANAAAFYKDRVGMSHYRVPAAGGPRSYVMGSDGVFRILDTAAHRYTTLTAIGNASTVPAQPNLVKIAIGPLGKTYGIARDASGHNVQIGLLEPDGTIAVSAKLPASATLTGTWHGADDALWLGMAFPPGSPDAAKYGRFARVTMDGAVHLYSLPGAGTGKTPAYLAFGRNAIWFADSGSQAVYRLDLPTLLASKL